MSNHSTPTLRPRIAVAPAGARFVCGDILDDDERFYQPTHPSIIGRFACPSGHTVGYFGAYLNEPAPACQTCATPMVVVA